MEAIHVLASRRNPPAEGTAQASRITNVMAPDSGYDIATVSHTPQMYLNIMFVIILGPCSKWTRLAGLAETIRSCVLRFGGVDANSTRVAAPDTVCLPRSGGPRNEVTEQSSFPYL